MAINWNDAQKRVNKAAKDTIAPGSGSAGKPPKIAPPKPNEIDPAMIPDVVFPSDTGHPLAERVRAERPADVPQPAQPVTDAVPQPADEAPQPTEQVHVNDTEQAPQSTTDQPLPPPPDTPDGGSEPDHPNAPLPLETPTEQVPEPVGSTVQPDEPLLSPDSPRMSPFTGEPQPTPVRPAEKPSDINPQPSQRPQINVDDVRGAQTFTPMSSGGSGGATFGGASDALGGGQVVPLLATMVTSLDQILRTLERIERQLEDTANG